MTSPELADAYRATSRAVRRSEARDAFIDRRVRELRILLAQTPMSATVDSQWAVASHVPIAVDMVAWVMETHDDPTLTLAQAVTSDFSAKRMQANYLEARAAAEADALAGDYFDDASILFEQGGM